MKDNAMSNGLGAGFGGLMLLAVLSVLAVLLSFSVMGVFVFNRRIGTVPRALRNLSVVLLLAVFLVTGFAVAALYDEATTLAVVFFAIVFVPLGVVGIYLHQTTDSPLLDTLATAGLAWSIPFLFGVIVIVGGLNILTGMFDVAPAESRRLGLHWIATAVGAGVVVSGTIWLSTPISRTVGAKTSR